MDGEKHEILWQNDDVSVLENEWDPCDKTFIGIEDNIVRDILLSNNED